MIVISDNFIGTTGDHIESRPPEIGTWSLRGDYAIIHTNRLTNDLYYNSYYNAVMPVATDQSITLTFTVVTFEAITLLLRMSAADPLNAYGFYYQSGAAEFVRYDAGVKTVLASYVLALVNGDKVKFDVTGTTLSVYINDVFYASVIDATHAQGVLGFLCGFNGSAQFWDDFVGEIAGEECDMLTLVGVH